MRRLLVTEFCAPSIKWLKDAYVGETFFVVGTGPSLLGFDWHRLDNKNVIAINNAIMHTRNVALFHHFADEAIYTRYVGLSYGSQCTAIVQNDAAVELCKNNPTLTANKSVRVFVRPGIKRVGLNDITKDDHYLYVHRTSATSAIMLAWKMGAGRVYLLGVDGYRLADGTYYCDGSKNTGLKTTPSKTDGDREVLIEPHNYWNENMHELKAYLETHAGDRFVVTNLSAKSTIDAWPKQPMDEVL